MKILLVEDEEHIAKGLVYNFENQEYETDWVASGEEALDKIYSQYGLCYDPHFDIECITEQLDRPGRNAAGNRWIRSCEANSQGRWEDCNPDVDGPCRR